MKTTDAVKSLAETKNKVVSHIKKNKAVYIAGAAGVAVGSIGVALTKGPAIQVNPQIKQILSYKPEAIQKVVVELTELSNLSKPVRIKGSTDPADIFLSQNDFAAKKGVGRSAISEHLNGKRDTAGGYQLEWLPVVKEPSQN